LFQNPVGFGTSFRENRSKPGFPTKFKVAVPKTEVLEQPQPINTLSTTAWKKGERVIFTESVPINRKIAYFLSTNAD
jgi:hypothetical protein